MSTSLPEGLCPIHVCGWHGNTTLLRALMQTGNVPIDFPDKYGNTACHYAVCNGHVDFLEVCVEEFKANLLLHNNGNQSILKIMTEGKLALVANEDWTVEWAMKKADPMSDKDGQSESSHLSN